MRALLDVNALLALLDPAHGGHARAQSWMADHLDAGWATCAITENGFVRVASQPTYPRPATVGAAMSTLAANTTGTAHEFWPSDLTLLDPAVIRPDRVHGHRQITDVYLLALAVAHGGRFVTFDQRVSLDAVPGATAQHLVVL